MATNKNYRKGFVRMGLGILAILVIGIVSYIGGDLYVDAGFPLRYTPTEWWEITGIGFLVILVGLVAICGAAVLMIALGRSIHWLAGFIGTIGEKKERTL